MATITYPDTMVYDGTENYLDSPVIAIFFVCSPPIFRDKKPTVNHWRIFCVLADGQSVELDMLKRDGSNRRGILGIKHHPYNCTNNRVMAVGGLPITSLTVREILHFLDQQGYLQYNYADSGVGCRFWIMTVGRALQDAGLIKTLPTTNKYTLTPADEIDDAVRYLWLDKDTKELSDITCGTFVPNS